MSSKTVTETVAPAVEATVETASGAVESGLDTALAVVDSTSSNKKFVMYAAGAFAVAATASAVVFFVSKKRKKVEVIEVEAVIEDSSK